MTSTYARRSVVVQRTPPSVSCCGEPVHPVDLRRVGRRVVVRVAGGQDVGHRHTAAQHDRRSPPRRPWSVGDGVRGRAGDSPSTVRRQRRRAARGTAPRRSDDGCGTATVASPPPAQQPASGRRRRGRQRPEDAADGSGERHRAMHRRGLEVDDRTGQGAGDALHLLDLGDHHAAELVDGVGLGPHDHVVGTGDVLGLQDAGDTWRSPPRRRRPCRPRSGSGCTPVPRNLHGGYGDHVGHVGKDATVPRRRPLRGDPRGGGSARRCRGRVPY